MVVGGGEKEKGVVVVGGGEKGLTTGASIRTVTKGFVVRRYLCQMKPFRGDGVAQLVERRTRIQRSRVRIPPVRSTRTICQFFRVKMLC